MSEDNTVTELVEPSEVRERLREHPTEDPNAYLTLLVEAGCLAAPVGREPRVSVTLSRPIVVEFRSEALAEQELTTLLSFVFRSVEGLEGDALQRARALRLLGLAVNAGLALDPAHVSVAQLGSDGAGISAHYTPDGKVELSTVQHDPRAHPYVRYEILFGIFDNLSLADERATLTRASRFAPFTVEINRWRLSRGLAAGLAFDGAKRHPNSLTTAIELDGREVGVASNYAADTPAVLLLHTRGVLCETLELEGKQPGFRAVVDLDLPKRLDQTQVLRGEAFDALLEAVSAAHDQLPPVELPRRGLGAPQRSEEPVRLGIYLVVVLVSAALFVFGPGFISKLISAPERGPWDSIPPRVTNSDPRAKLACSEDEPLACIRLAQFELERGAQDSAAQAERLLATACPRHEDACAQRQDLDDALVAGQRWVGEFSCAGEPVHAVLDISADSNRSARLRYWLDGDEQLAQLGMHLDGTALSTDLRHPTTLEQLDFIGTVEGERITGKVRSPGCSSFEFALASGVRPLVLPD